MLVEITSPSFVPSGDGLHQDTDFLPISVATFTGLAEVRDCRQIVVSEPVFVG